MARAGEGAPRAHAAKGVARERGSPVAAAAAARARRLRVRACSSTAHAGGWARSLETHLGGREKRAEKGVESVQQGSRENRLCANERRRRPPRAPHAHMAAARAALTCLRCVCLLRRVDWSSPRPLPPPPHSHRPTPSPTPRRRRLASILLPSARSLSTSSHHHVGADVVAAAPLADAAAPISAVATLVDSLHTVTGLPWWATIPATAFGERVVGRRWWGSGGCFCFASRLTPKNTPSPGVRLALTPLSLLQARAAATAGPLLVQARAAAAVAKSGDKGGAPSFASVAAEVSSLARERRGMGVHPAWVVAAPLAQVRREGAVCGWSAKPSLVFPLCLLPHPPSTIRSPSLPPLSWAFAPWRWPTGPALPLAAPSGRPT